MTDYPWSTMTAAQLVQAIIGDAEEFAWIRGQLKVALAMPSAKRFAPADAGTMKEVLVGKST